MKRWGLAVIVIILMTTLQPGTALGNETDAAKWNGLQGIVLSAEDDYELGSFLFDVAYLEASYQFSDLDVTLDIDKLVDGYFLITIDVTRDRLSNDYWYGDITLEVTRMVQNSELQTFPATIYSSGYIFHYSDSSLASNLSDAVEELIAEVAWEYYEHERYQLSLAELIRKGNLAYDAEDYEKAIDYYDRAIELDPDFYKAYFNKGIALFFGLGQSYQAIECWRKVLELNPPPEYEEEIRYVLIPAAEEVLREQVQPDLSL